MYCPPKFRNNNLEDILEFMHQNPFATIIANKDNELVISHLPLVSKYENGKIILTGHMSRANEQWKFFTTSKITSIFHGAHTYITPTWYEENDVPTWNYSALHATGEGSLIEDFKGIVTCLKELSLHAEEYWPSGWDFFLPEDLKSETDLRNAIVAFQIHICDFDNSISFINKLSQNRSEQDIAGVILGLSKRADDNSRRILSEMKKIYKIDTYNNK